MSLRILNPNQTMFKHEDRFRFVSLSSHFEVMLYFCKTNVYKHANTDQSNVHVGSLISLEVSSYSITVSKIRLISTRSQRQINTACAIKSMPQALRIFPIQEMCLLSTLLHGSVRDLLVLMPSYLPVHLTHNITLIYGTSQ